MTENDTETGAAGGDRVFALPDRLRHRDDPTTIADDEAFFALLADRRARIVAEVADRLAAERRATGDGGNNEAVERDMRIHRLSARLRAARRFGPEICLGHVTRVDGTVLWIGRQGVSDDDGEPLVVDWRSPAAAPFFAATHGTPSGLARRRRYRWSRGHIVDYWDEVFGSDDLATEGTAALDDQSAFIASLGSHRSSRMRDVLATIQADQDAIIRAGSQGALVVDGGPGTGKTVVALHRAAYLLHADPRLHRRRGGVLVVGPHQPYLSYVADVLPGLGEDGVRTCTLADLVPEGATAGAESDPEVARLKATAAMATDVVETAVRFHEQPPADGPVVATPWTDVAVTADDWSAAFSVVEPGTPHNEARDRIWAELLDLLVERHADRVGPTELRSVLARDRALRSALTAAWPLLAATDVIGDLWTVPAYLRLCAPWLDRDEVRRLQRPTTAPWTRADLPLLDAARRRLGDATAARRERERLAAAEAENAYRARVVDDLIRGEVYDDGEGVMGMLRGADLTEALLDPDAVPVPDPDGLAGPFAHIVVDEAQELTDAEWQMLRRRCPSGSVTVVGDRAQARRGFGKTWTERLQRVGLRDVEVATLTVNYRTPEEVMAEAAPVIRAVLPDANVPVSVRRSGLPVVHLPLSDRDAVLSRWVAAGDDGIACVVGDPAYPGTDRISSLTPELSKGLEFDLVVLVDPAAWGDGIPGAVDRYVAMTRSTRQLVMLEPD